MSGFLTEAEKERIAREKNNERIDSWKKTAMQKYFDRQRQILEAKGIQVKDLFLDREEYVYDPDKSDDWQWYKKLVVTKGEQILEEYKKEDEESSAAFDSLEEELFLAFDAHNYDFNDLTFFLLFRDLYNRSRQYSSRILAYLTLNPKEIYTCNVTYDDFLSSQEQDVYSLIKKLADAGCQIVNSETIELYFMAHSKAVQGKDTDIRYECLKEYNDIFEYQYHLYDRIEAAQKLIIENNMSEHCSEQLNYWGMMLKKCSVLRGFIYVLRDISYYFVPNSFEDWFRYNTAMAIHDVDECTEKLYLKEREQAFKHFNEDDLETMIAHLQSQVFKVELPKTVFDPFQGFKIEDLPDKDKPFEWQVDGMFIQGGANMIVGPSKSGKSQVSYLLANAIQNGVPFLGEYKTIKTGVLYLDFELNQNEIADRFNKVKDYYKKYHDVELSESITVFPMNGQEYDFETICIRTKMYLINHQEIGTVFFDNVQSMIDEEFDTNSNAQVRELIRNIKSVAKDKTIFYICHTNKTSNLNGGNADAINAAEGSNAFGSSADECMTIINKADGKEYIVEGRHVSGADKKKIVCRYGKDTFFLPVPVKDECEAKEVAGIKALKKPEKLKEEYPDIYEFLSEPDPKTGKKGKTLKSINEKFPDETRETLKEKGFYYSGKNGRNLKIGYKTDNYYADEIPFKE